MFEKIVRKRFTSIIVPAQAGFRPEKSCPSQLLDVTQDIEDGFEEGKITGAVFVDLLAVYDAVNHQELLVKLYHLTADYRLTQIVGMMLLKIFRKIPG